MTNTKMVRDLTAEPLLLTEEETAVELAVSVEELETWRTAGVGPLWGDVFSTGTIRYWREKVLDFKEGRHELAGCSG